MAYTVEIIKKHQSKTTKWTGGTTTQLYIYPKESTYVGLDFKWRLSSAKVELDQSTFTPLPEINRLIMVIEGELLLAHEGHYTVKLKEFEKDSFSGNWVTTSFGRVTDFNLMMKKGYSGTLECLSLHKGEVKDICLYNNTSSDERLSEITEAFYIAKGGVELLMGGNEKAYLYEGDIVLITRSEKELNSEFNIHSICKEEAKIIKASIFNKDNF